jgi:hypothetical protein
MIQRFLLTKLLVLLASGLFGQTGNATLSGKVLDAETNAPVADATVVLTGTGKFVSTDADGAFTFQGIAPGTYAMVVSGIGFLPLEQSAELRAGAETKVEFALRKDPNAEEVPTVSLENFEDENDGDLGATGIRSSGSTAFSQNSKQVANLLRANRDVYQNIAGFGWSIFRFRERGYDGSQSPVYVNGIQLNDPETGFSPYADFSGLNDVFRNRSASIGLDPADFAFGDVGGATFLDTRAAQQRKQVRGTYSLTNRIYRQRAMLTMSTGLMPGGWAVSVSGSRRWAEEGYVPGTFFDGYAYFLSVDKQVNSKHNLNLTVFGSPNKRGRSADSFQEMYDIAGTNYYNPLWGYQNGKKRNAQVSTNHQPTAIMRYDWTPSRKTKLMASAYGQIGRTGFTRINWQNAANPAPDFNRRLPSSLLDTAQATVWATLLSQDEALRQIDWAALYEANGNNPASIQNAEGITGNTISGKRSVYILENQRTDNKEFGANVLLSHSLNSRTFLSGGGSYLWYEGRNYKVIEDLLGGDFWPDFDFFGQFDSEENQSGRQSDARRPNNLAYKGDEFGYNYLDNIRTANAWAQVQFSLPRFQFHAGLQGNQTKQWRTGLMQNGRQPSSSLGDSEVFTWNTYSIKAGGVFKINGRNYLYANGMYGTRPPQIREVFLNPTIRNTSVPNVSESIVRSVEGGYILRAPRLRARLTGYVSEFLNETEVVFGASQSVSRVLTGIDLSGINLDDDDSFLQVPIFFGGASAQDFDRRHAGVELGVEYKPHPSWTFSAAGTMGKHIYINRPTLYLAPDNVENLVLNAGEIYMKNYYVPRVPQTAGTFSVRYESRKFWSATMSVNYMDQLWYAVDPVRHTARFVDGLEQGSAVWNQLLEQKKAPSAYTIDFFGSKSWRVRSKYFIYLNIGINNLLDNQNIVVSGRDSYRNAFRSDVSDARFYTHELIYAPGLNYFVSIAFRAQ